MRKKIQYTFIIGRMRINSRAAAMYFHPDGTCRRIGQKFGIASLAKL
jgi:hypothetical protein